tara:strand:+ start:129708 stop:130607 length:900 start_codon:yes stop_codon:yes gene_type:complete
MKKRLVGIIVLNYNCFEETVAFIKNIQNQQPSFPLKMLIVDNNSSDNSYKQFVEEFRFDAEVDFIKTKSNLGYGAGNNCGIKYLKDKYNLEYLMICNPDIKISIENIPKILKDFQIDKMIAAVSIQMIDVNNLKKLSAWKLPDLIDDLILSISILNKVFTNKIYYTDSSKPRYVEVLQGAFLIIKSEAMDYIGGYDEKVFLYGEERILGYKLKKAGYKLYFNPNFTFIHKIGASIEKEFPLKSSKFMIMQQSRRHYHKHYLNQNWIKLTIFDFFSFVGKLEKMIFDFLKLTFSKNFHTK